MGRTTAPAADHEATGAPSERELTELLARETAAREAAELARRHSEFLGEATALLSSSLNVEVTLANLTRLAVPVLADWCFVDLVEEDGTILPGPVACADATIESSLRLLHSEYPLTWDSPRPQGRVLRDRRSLLLPTMAGEWLAANFEDPDLARLIEALHVTSAMVVPMIARDRLVGVISFSTTGTRRTYDQHDLVLAEEVAASAALAIDNAFLYEAAERARAEAEESAARSRFLAEASVRLSTALDEPALIQQLTKLVVPARADWCVFDMVEEDGSTRRWVTCHGTPEQRALARELEESFPIDLNAADNIVVTVMRTGEPSLVTSIPDDQWTTGARNQRHQEILRELGPKSHIIVPLTARGRTLGALTLASGDGGRTFGSGDLDLAMDFGRRVALAIDNTRLFQEQVQARTRIQSLAAERDAVLGQIADGVIIADTDGRLVFVNEAAARLHGVDELDVPIERYAETYHLSTMDGRPFPPEDLPLARAVLHGEIVMDAEWRIRRPDGSELIAQGSATPVLAGDGGRLGAVLTLRDVTAQREFERSKADFIATASHDLKTPLTTIKGWAQLLLQRTRTDPHRARDVAALTAIVAQAKTMQRLIDQLLDASRLQLGQEQPLRPRLVDLVGLTRRLVAEHQVLTDRHELEMTAHRDRIAGVWDADRVEQIIANLLSNAVKYSPDGGTIAIVVDSDGLEASVAVHDRGLGIPAADLPRIFDRHFRVARHAKAGIVGTGLGLFSARYLARRMDGRIDVESEDGVGSAFTLVLPVMPAPASDTTAMDREHRSS